MRRTIWFSLCCLVGIAVLVGIRALSPFVGKDPTKIADSFGAEDPAPLVVKVDKLVGTADELPPDKITVKTVKVVPQSPVKQETGLVASQKHWRPVYASMRDRARHATRHHKKRPTYRSRR